ncbi:MAG: type II toxin-antitoxin system RelE/ParE family toxin [Vulcanimicrobiaceae bacterium]
MFEIRVSPEYDAWLTSLRDAVGKAKVVGRIARLQASEHWGDAKPIGGGIVEVRIDYGPGYRVYCKKIGRVVVLLLIGGAKSTQKRDIQRAKEIAKAWQA